MINTEFSECISACTNCSLICTECATSCLKEKDLEMMRECIQRCLECADICQLCVRMQQHNSPFSKRFVSFVLRSVNIVRKSVKNIHMIIVKNVLRLAVSVQKNVEKLPCKILQ
jgi:hypothetical protein